ncbi:hypothetical protein PtA15_5A288 [Puccinia triticina]|uniref:Uncharacterized protein n=1 Tax=Puccinia triticina TaxID=208348 RepID=A0ABY7CI01_9BASI|nr:uncharacterized protein PtA15_5A288 [Puccinia triticina]WAQ84715.1 hypothetical protein PtA15_5A288 [Puccinia triticina]
MNDLRVKGKARAVSDDGTEKPTLPFADAPLPAAPPARKADKVDKYFERAPGVPRINRHTGWERSLSTVLKIWFSQKQAKYTGSIHSDARVWLSDLQLSLEMIHAHPLLWHTVGFNMLDGWALDKLKVAREDNNEPQNWPAFKAWLTKDKPPRDEQTVCCPRLKAASPGSKQNP